MNDLLKQKDSSPGFSLVSERRLDKKSPLPDQQRSTSGLIQSAEDSLSILQSQPTVDQVNVVLKDLLEDKRAPEIHSPAPKSAKIVQVLARDIIPNHWHELGELSHSVSGDDIIEVSAERRRLLKCFESVTGLNALLNILTGLCKSSNTDGSKSVNWGAVNVYLDVLSCVLAGQQTIRRIWINSVQSCQENAARKTQSQALLTLLANGRLVSLAAELDRTLGDQEDNPTRNGHWISNGATYCQWLAKNLSFWAVQHPDSSEKTFCQDLFSRSLSLGYTGKNNHHQPPKQTPTNANEHIESLSEPLIKELLISHKQTQSLFAEICLDRAMVIPKMLPQLLKFLDGEYLSKSNQKTTQLSILISAVAGVINTAIGNMEPPRKFLIKWCTSPVGAGVGDSSGIRRAVVAVLAQHADSVVTIFQKSISQFGDELYLKHTSILQQEGELSTRLFITIYTNAVLE